MTRTAIEIFVERLNEKIDFIPIAKWDEIKNLIDQAKEIEKEQIKQAYQKGVISLSNRTADQYYEQTFNK